MRRNALALTLLAAFAFGLLAGPHPCGARHGEGKDRHSSSCHGTMEAGHADPARVSSNGATNCCETLCLHACHMTAVADAAPAAFAIAPVAQSIAEATDLGLSLFAYAIEHVPLA